MREALHVRHCSRRAVQADVGWIRRFILFQGRRPRVTMAAEEVMRFPSDLAADGKVSASTRNQALNALLPAPGFAERNAVVIFDFEHAPAQVPLEPPIRGFEQLARTPGGSGAFTAS